jgi:hypothetical protein
MALLVPHARPKAGSARAGSARLVVVFSDLEQTALKN